MTHALIGRATAALAALALAGGLALPAAAQTAQQPLQPTEVTPEQLESFAAAAAEVQTLGQQWQSRIDSAATQEEAAQMGQQAQVEMIEAVEAEGLTVDEYNQIFQLAQADPAVEAQIMEHMPSAQ